MIPAETFARWYPLRAIREQQQYARSTVRFIVCPAGRRAGKTEFAKRKLVETAAGGGRRRPNHLQAARYFAGAPTRLQAKQIYWEDLKALSRPFWRGKPSESELTIRLKNGSEILVFGMDKPERFEGQPWDGGVLDEFANMRPGAWSLNVRPALSDRNGWCDLIGVPEGRNHYFDTYKKALAAAGAPGSEWAAFTWFSSCVLPPSEIEAARADLDELSFKQEYEASFINFTGRAYHAYSEENERAVRHLYNPQQTLVLCFDFNVSPGVAVVAQPMREAFTGELFTAVIGEVWIPDNSNTERVCRKLLSDWGQHHGRVEVYGDATGGARGSAKTAGSDWDIIRRMLRVGDSGSGLPGFGSRVSYHYPEANPTERARINAVNTRCKNTSGQRRLFVDPTYAPHVVRDLEGVQLLEGGSGEIDKDGDATLTHISDALGYYVVARFPIGGSASSSGTFSVGG